MTASRTALAAALMRAIHTRLDRPRLIDDPWGERLVSDDEKGALVDRILAEATPDARRRLEALGSQRAVLDVVLRRHPTYGGVVLRTRYAEDALATAAAGGVRQYVLIGAGLDSFCVRQPPYARALDIFEVDQPASQALKRARLADAAVAANVRFVAADLASEPLGAALALAGFSSSAPAFFSWLGVTIYLPRAANLATLRAIATCAAPGSELVFTYFDQRVLDAGVPTLEAMRAQRAAMGEPWISGFDPTSLTAELRDLGLDLIEDLTGQQLTERYCAGRSDGLAAGRAGHVARVRVGFAR
ncbi:class I SAM-dependent methyltransferase [bacterium]|nr:class I SAM-dependent methyltransferase [bacterium]